MTIYFNSVAIDRAALRSLPQEDIERLLTGAYNDRDLEILRTPSPYRIFSLRINRVERLLFTIHKGKLLILEHLPTHDYQKSLYLNHGVLAESLKKDSTASIRFSALEPDELRPVFTPSTKNEFVALHYYQRQFIALSDEQSRVANVSALPLTINGAAGTGKSVVGLSLMSNAIKANSETEGRYLYISQSKLLVDDMRTNWTSGFVGRDRHEVEFKTYDDLLPEGRKILSNTFQAWYGGLKDDPRIPLTSAEAFYNEFRICSGFTEEGYLALGVRQTVITDLEARAVVYSLYNRYVNYLNNTRLIDPAFEVLNQPHDTYDLIIVDEAQNLSLHQHSQLVHLARNNAIVFCMDSHQNVFDSNPILSLLEQSFRNKHLELTTHTLKQTHRYTKQIASALTHIMAMGRKVLGGISDKHEALTMPVDMMAEEGQVQLIELNSKLPDTTWLNELGNSTQFAVITTDDYVDEAIAMFKTPLVFTPKQIIGQEYKHIVIYKFWSDEYSKTALKAIKPYCINTEISPVHRRKDKHDNLNQAYISWLNAYYVGCSRAIETLVIMEEMTHHNRFFWEGFAYNAASPISKPLAIESNWGDEVQKQRMHGNEAIATRIEQTQSLKAPALNESISELDIKPASQTIKNATSKHKKKPMVKSQHQTVASLPPVFNEKLSRDLYVAVEKNDIKKIKSLLDNPQVDANFKHAQYNMTPLMNAFYENNIKSAIMLINHKNVDINCTGAIDNCTALFLATRSNLEAVKELLKRDEIKINHANSLGATALYYVAQNGEFEVVELLLKCKGIEIDYPNKDNVSPLNIAAQTNRTGIVDLLLTHPNIDINRANSMGNTALHFAAINGNDHIFYALMARSDIDINCKNEDGLTPLRYAAAYGHIKIIDALLKRSEININAKDSQGITGLYMAAQNGHFEVVRALLARDNIDTEVMVTTRLSHLKALDIAILNDHTEIVRAFLKRDEKNIIENGMFLVALIVKAQKNPPLFNLLLEDISILKIVLINLATEPDLSVGFICLITKLRSDSENVWLVFKSHVDALDLQEGIQILETIRDNEKNPLHIILLKSPPRGPFFDDATRAVAMRKGELNELIAMKRGCLIVTKDNSTHSFG